MPRQSLLASSNKTYKLVGPKPLTQCVRCLGPVNPGFCYTGSVVDGLGFSTHLTMERPKMATEFHEVIKKVAFIKRKRGFLCDECAANYHTIEDAKGNKTPLVMTDPRPGYMGIIMDAKVHKDLKEPEPIEERVEMKPEVIDNHWLNVGRK